MIDNPTLYALAPVTREGRYAVHAALPGDIFANADAVIDALRARGYEPLRSAYLGIDRYDYAYAARSADAPVPIRGGIVVNGHPRRAGGHVAGTHAECLAHVLALAVVTVEGRDDD